MSSLRLGCDLCQTEALQQMLQDDHGAVERLFTSEERTYAMGHQEPAQHLAGVFAAKEALMKAVRDSTLLGNYYREVTVGHRPDGAPYLRLSEALSHTLSRVGMRVLDCSISHDGAYAIAAVLVELTDHQGVEDLQTAGSQVGGSSTQEGTDRRHCTKCLLTLDYLRKQRIAEVLIKAEAADGTLCYLCPVCLRGW